MATRSAGRSLFDQPFAEFLELLLEVAIPDHEDPVPGVFQLSVFPPVYIYPIKRGKYGETVYGEGVVQYITLKPIK